MSFADKLVTEPQREKSGETGYERYDYQALWGLALIFDNHGSMTDYALAFEFHDDIVLLDKADAPTNARFYQVKTKDRGHWTLNQLTKQKAKTPPSTEKLPSHIGKLFSNYVLFPDETVSLNFVSNVPCEFVSAGAGSHPLVTCTPEAFAAFLEKLQAEHPSATSETATLIHFIEADLSLHDASTHIRGKLQNFVATVLGSVEYNLDTLYKSVVEECRSRSKFTGAINSFEELVRHKAITRAQVEGWLDHVRARQQAPEWSEICHGLVLPALELAAIHRGWKRYRAVALNPGDEAVNRIKDKVRAQIQDLVGSALQPTELLQRIYEATQGFANANMTPFAPARLKAMILHEVYVYDPSGEVQTAYPQPQDRAS